MVEHTVRDREVRGSSPLIPTDECGQMSHVARFPPPGVALRAEPSSRIHPALRDEGGKRENRAEGVIKMSQKYSKFIFDLF